MILTGDGILWWRVCGAEVVSLHTVVVVMMNTVMSGVGGVGVMW